MVSSISRLAFFFSRCLHWEKRRKKSDSLLCKVANVFWEFTPFASLTGTLYNWYYSERIVLMLISREHGLRIERAYIPNPQCWLLTTECQLKLLNVLNCTFRGSWKKIDTHKSERAVNCVFFTISRRTLPTRYIVSLEPSLPTNMLNKHCFFKPQKVYQIHEMDLIDNGLTITYQTGIHLSYPSLKINILNYENFSHKINKRNEIRNFSIVTLISVYWKCGRKTNAEIHFPHSILNRKCENYWNECVVCFRQIVLWMAPKRNWIQSDN